MRWGLAGAAVVIVVLLGYLATGSLTTSERVYLASGRRYGPDDLVKITRLLESRVIDYHIDDRRVAVASEQLDTAIAAISKLELGPRPPGEIRDDQSAGSSFLDTLHDKELREHQGREKILESMISDLPGILGAFVQINRPKPGWALQPVIKPSAFVRLETEADRQLPFRTVQTLTTILTGTEPGLTADAVTVVDRRGHKYLDAGNPALSALSHNRAREEELSQNILEQLDWISGVRVSVQLSETVSSAADSVRAEQTGAGRPSKRSSRDPCPSRSTATRQPILKPLRPAPPSQSCRLPPAQSTGLWRSSRTFLPCRPAPRPARPLHAL